MPKGFRRIFCGRIEQHSAGPYLRAGRELCGINLAGPHNVLDRKSLGQQIVGDDAAVAAPPHGFGAHDGAAIVAGERFQFFQSHVECSSRRVVGIIAKPRDLPEHVRRRCRSLLSMTPAAKSGQEAVSDPGGGERFR